MRPNLPKHATMDGVDRRRFLGAACAATAAVLAPSRNALAAAPITEQPKIAAFIKYIQSLSYDDMANSLAEIGFDGIESTVRRGGHVEPERVEDDLPKQFEAVSRAGLEMTFLATGVLSIDQPHTESVLRTAASLGVKRYRMGSYRYDQNRGVVEQLDEIKPKMRDLAAMNRELGITGVYQNHSGARHVGAPVWDAYLLVKDLDPKEVGIAFDIRHAMVEGGLAWPLHYDLVKPHLGAVFVKDFDWVGRSARHVPLGSGRVEKKFFKMHRDSGIDVPFSLHVEYLKDGGAQGNLAALKRDLGVLRGWLAS